MQFREDAVTQGETAKKKAMQAEIQAMVTDANGNVDTNLLRQLFAKAIGMGDVDAARSLSEVLKVIENRTNTTDTGAYMIFGEEGAINPATGNPEQFLLDRRTGKRQWLGVAPKPPAPNAFNTGMTSDQQNFQRENSLRDDYRAEVQSPAGASLVDSYNFIESALSNRTKAIAGDAAARVQLLYGFVKALDPNSVVREGELALANAAAPFRSRMERIYADYLEGKSPAVPTEVVESMIDLMQQMQAAKEENWQKIYDSYVEAATTAGVRTTAFRKPPDTWRKKLGTSGGVGGGFGPFAPVVPKP
jgi:hypothetical protein